MPIQRSWMMTLVWTLIMLLLLGLAAFMGFSGEYLIAGVLAFCGLLSMVGVGSGSYVTDCPVCGKQLRGLMGLKRCPQCFSYGKVFEGEFYELEPNFVNKAPLLALPLGDRREMPPLCCACGAPAARTERLRIIRVEFAFDLDAPHCVLHTGGADLDSESIAGRGKAQAPVLKVKSYAFYRAYVEANYPGVTNQAFQTVHT
ncbi:MAG TPA: hypothetical protein VIK39_16825 [Candidatus Angelobacter sp.]|jgi:hypothetical protein